MQRHAICTIAYKVIVKLLHQEIKNMDGSEIKQVRQSMGQTQEEFAHQLGVTLSTVNRWENKKTAPSRLAVKQIKMLIQREGVHIPGRIISKAV